MLLQPLSASGLVWFPSSRIGITSPLSIPGFARQEHGGFPFLTIKKVREPDQTTLWPMVYRHGFLQHWVNAFSTIGSNRKTMKAIKIGLHITGLLLQYEHCLDSELEYTIFHHCLAFLWHVLLSGSWVLQWLMKNASVLC